ncbi:MAG: ABC transporter ATP-binding protein [Patescibacteria group bacterium]
MKKEMYSTSALLRDLYDFMQPYKGRFFLAACMRIFAHAIWLYPTYALAAITTFFTTYTVGESILPFWHIITTLSLVIFVFIVFVYYANSIAFPIAEKIKIDVQLRTIRHMFLLDIAWHEKENTGNKVKRIDRGSESLNQMIRMAIGPFIEMIVGFVGAIFIISRFDRIIGILTLVFLVLYFLMSVYYTRTASKAKKTENIKDEEFSGLIFESANNIRSVKVMSMAKPISQKLSDIGAELFPLISRRVFWYQSGGAVKHGLGQLFRIAIMSYIGWGIMNGQYNVGFLVLFYGYFSNVLEVVTRMADVSQEFAVKKQDIGRMVDILHIAPISDIEEGKVSMPKEWKEIEVKNVSFSYGEKKVLDDVSFTISRGEKIGIMGLSGAGKSTLFKLLLKERENYDGEILIDYVPLRTISKIDYFKHAAVVLQETEVFNFSLRNNITLSNFEREDDEKLFAQALTVAHVTDFAQKLPQGVDTQIGEKGIKLSGGEKQRIGVARAIFKEPQLLLLDEATSHLDVESEEKIQDSLHKFFQSVTAIVIAHRLTTIKEMDKILVMEGGKIIEQGNFDELYKKKGRFFELWEKQKLD